MTKTSGSKSGDGPASVFIDRLPPFPYGLPGSYPIRMMHRYLQGVCEHHAHNFHELVCVLEGEGSHVFGKERYRVSQGDVFVLPPDEVHYYEEMDGLILSNICYYPERIEMPEADLRSVPGYHALFLLEPQQRRKDGFDSRLRLAPTVLSEVLYMLDKMNDEIESEQPGHLYMAIVHFLQIIGRLSRAYEDSQAPSVKPLLQTGKAISYIEKNYTNQIRLEEIASIAGMSKVNLIRCFRKALGVSPIDYLIRVRIARATELLRGTSMSVTDVAFEVGFNDSNYFARQFRRIIDTTPSKYRKEHLRAPGTVADRIGLLRRLGD